MYNIYEFLRLAAELGNKYGVQLPKPTVAVLGSYNAGKSTLINGLLQTNLSPVDIVPSTKGLIFFKYGETFQAEVQTGKLKSQRFKRKNDFIQFLTDRSNRNTFEQAEVFIHSPLLKKITLVDSPGLDGPLVHDRSMEKLIKNADRLVYLFHQRGIEEFNKRFLLQLVEKYKQKKMPKISFWINCNLGNFDGTSLEETRLVLREIFSCQPDIFSINTRDPKNLDLFKCYLEIDAAEQVLGQIRKTMLQKDHELGQSAVHTVNTEYNAEFLLNFDRLKQTAEDLIGDRERLNKSANARRQLLKLLEINNKLNIRVQPNMKISNEQNKTSFNFNEIKELLLELIDRVMRGPAQKFTDHRALAALAGQIKKENFTIVAAGGFSSGKSTFFNALMSENLLPAQSKPTTFAITQISYGSHKKAVVHFASRVTLQLYDRINGKIEPRSDELNALSQWLINNHSEITAYEIYENRHFRRANHRECLNVLQDINQLVNRSRGDLSVPPLYKLVPAKLSAQIRLTEKVRLTFKSAGESTFDLTQETGQKAFYSAINSNNTFRLERVEVYHPVEYFKLASFLDTPGLDSTHKYHSEITTDYLQNSDAYLIFLNARQLLLSQGQNNPVEIISNRIKDYLKLDPKACQKIFFVLNFADTLTRLEREKVIQFVKEQLTSTIQEPQIYLISSLSALLQKDDGSFQRFINNLAKTVTNYRGKDILTRYVNEIRFILNNAVNTEQIKSATKVKQNLSFIKHSAAQYILKKKTVLINEINTRFCQLEKLIRNLKDEQDFYGFIQGISEQKKGLLFKNTKKVSCPSYFGWAADLNDYLTRSCAAITEQLAVSLNRQLSQFHLTTALHLTARPLQTLKISKMHKQVTDSLERNRGFLGRIKEREIQRDLLKLLTKEQLGLIENLSFWEKKLLKEIEQKLEPAYTGLMPNLEESSTGKRQISIRNTLHPIIKDVLKELNKIERLLNYPGVDSHGKR
ncbi:dynamin family protein [Desulfolucanica intricata]|uniref:dynamin family protein n=1 Tax=Desulfolucanica intricata TaxID=1285191 RepID=UPI0008329DAF|nr:dynamin family protein [Desulfolucanica intricata]